MGRLEDENHSLRVSIERLLSEQVQLNARIAKMGEDIEFFNNLTIKASLRELGKAIYRGIRHRTIHIIWGSKSYKSTDKLLNLKIDFKLSKAQALDAILVLNDSDRKNAPLLLRDTKIRRTLYEMARKCMLITKKTLRIIWRKA